MSKKNVAVIDKNMDIQQLLKALIEKEFDAECTNYSSFEDFQVLYAKSKVDLIISDDLGPVKNRKLFFDFLDQHGFCGHIIIFTAYSKNKLPYVSDTDNLEVVYEKRLSELISLLKNDEILYSKK